MKKFLLTAALVLALVTSLTAGTMAYYSTTIGTITSSVQTKFFSFSADRDSGSWQTDVKIAPGDTLTYQITVYNDSEVSTNAKFKAELVKEFGNSLQDGMTVTVTRADSKGVTGDSSKTDAKSVELATKMGLSTSAVYTVKVSWAAGTAYGNDLTKALQDKAITLNMNISGEQSVDSITTDMLSQANVVR